MSKYFKLKNYINYFKNKIIKYKKFYSQNGEDVILNSFLKDKDVGVYVDIGANDPKKFSNTYFLQKRLARN